MVRLTDEHAEALALVGQGTLTHKQIESVLDVFSGSGMDTSNWRFYRVGSLEYVSLGYHAWVDDKCVTLANLIGDSDADIEALVRGFIWGGVSEVFNLKLEVGHDIYDYALEFQSMDKAIWGALFFRLNRTPYEVID